MSFEAFMGSIPGPYHLKENKPNQDWVQFHTEGDWFMAALADGAGSLSRSHIGAEEAVVAALNKMWASRDLPIGEIPKLGLDVARAKQKSYDDYKQYGSTLSLIAMKTDGTWASGAVGDSFGVIHMEDGTHQLITGTPHGEYANITELLTSKKIHPLYSSGDGAKAFSLSSDGLESVSIFEKKAHAGFWDGIVERAALGRLSVSDLFQWLGTQDKIIDDTTLLTVVKR